MKKHINKALLAIASLALITQSADAANATYNPDDLFIGFTQDDNTTSDYLIDIGPASLYRDAVAGFTLNLGNTTQLLTDLNTAFGSTWQTDGTVHWGLIGTPGASATSGDPGNLIYASSAEDGSVGTQATPPISSSSQSAARNNILTMKGYFISLPVTSGTSATVTNAVIGNPTNAGSWTAEVANAFGETTQLPNIQGSFGSGLTGTALDLFRIAQQSGGVNGTYEGTFTIATTATTATIHFDTAVIPEPSTYALTGIGVLGLMVWVRRFRHTATA